MQQKIARVLGIIRARDRGCGMMAFSRLSTWALGAAVVLLAGQAAATTSYGSYVGPNVTYTNMQETSTSGDPEPIWEAPTGLANQLLFFPTNFRANANPTNGPFDHTGSQFQTLISGTSPTDVLTALNITEFGDAQIAGFGVGAGTGTFASMAGFLTVLSDINGPITPVVIPFTGVFTPSDTLTFGSNFGTTIWSATVSINIAAYVENATSAQLSLDNDLYAFSEATTTAAIQKKVVNGPAVIIEVIPEPGTAILVGGGLLVMAIRGRRTRGC